MMFLLQLVLAVHVHGLEAVSISPLGHTVQSAVIRRAPSGKESLQNEQFIAQDPAELEKAWADARVAGSIQAAQAVGSSQEAEAAAKAEAGQEQSSKVAPVDVAEGSAATVDAVAELEAHLRVFYSAVAPEELPKARQIAEYYVGRQELLSERMRKNYGKDIETFETHADIPKKEIKLEPSNADIPKNAIKLDSTNSFPARAIPPVLHFNHKKNILLESVPRTDGLKINIQKIIDMHPGSNVTFLDDVQCRSALARTHSEELASFFDKEAQGFYKSDLCRLAALYEQGGYYFDNDFEVVTDVRGIIPEGASISTVMALTDRGTPSIGLDGRLDVFQAFLAAAPKHPVIMAAMDSTLKWYQRGEYLDEHNGQRLMWWNHPRRDGPCETIDPDRCHQVLAGPVFVGKALRDWLKVEYLRVGHMDEGRGCQWTGDMMQNRCAYLFTETDDLELYKLPERNKETGWPRCVKEPYHGWCNIAVADGKQQFGWSRSPEAAEFEGYEDASLDFRVMLSKLRQMLGSSA